LNEAKDQHAKATASNEETILDLQQELEQSKVRADQLEQWVTDKERMLEESE